MKYDEIYVIEESGIPFYYYRGGAISLVDNSFYTLQSGLFTALLDFAKELGEGDLKYVVFDNKTYTFKKSKNILLVIGIKEKLAAVDLNEVENVLDKFAQQLQDLIPTAADSPAYEMSEKQIEDFEDSFGNFLVREKIIEQPALEKVSSFRATIQNLALKSIGYTPGVCNIGRTERLKRLTNGFLVFIASLVLYGVIALVPAIRLWTVFLLLLPLTITFMQIYQYSFKFCVRNALTRQYNMS